MNMIQVLLSTYNGEDYLRQQLDSILDQQDVQVRLLIRDDGSSDGTMEILREYEAKDERVSVYQGENLGASASFFDLIARSGESDYYAFSDQDDVWEPRKLAEGIRAIREKKAAGPVLYYSNLKIVDEDLVYHRMAHAKPHVQDNKYCGIVGNMASGCTMVLNRSAMDLIRTRRPASCEMHDWWIFLVCGFFGELVYDMNSYIRYRQHGDNVAGTYLDRVTAGFVMKRIRSLVNPQGEPRYTMARNLLECYGDIMTEADRRKVRKFVEYKKNVLSNLRLLFDFDFHGANRKRDVLYRISIILRAA